MSGLKAIIADRTGGGQAGVDDGGPTLQAVMMVTVKQVRRADGNGRGSDLDGRKRSVIVHHVIGQQDFLAAAAAHI
jgi:hypothetical protein